MDIVEKLDQLAELQSQRDALQLKKQELLDRLLTPEIKAQMAEIEEEFAGPLESIGQSIATLEGSVRADVIAGGQSIKGNFIHAVFSKPRVTWDGKLLEGYAVVHPELLAMRKEGEPSVSFRKIG